MAERDPKTGRFPPRPQAPKGGRGYGGAAKGEGSKAGLTPEVRALRWDEAKLAEKAVRTDALKGVMWEIAMDAAEAAPARINAADKLLDREEGKAVQRQDIKVRSVNPDEMTDEELAAVIKAEGGSGAGSSQGA